MLNAPLARVFRRMVSRVSTPGIRSRRTVLEVTQNSLEARLAPATLAAPTVDSTTAQFVRVGPPATTTIDFLNVQTASNPQDPLRQVVVAQEERSDGKALIIARSSIDGGTTWTTFASFGGGNNNKNIGGDGSVIGDPTIDRGTTAQDLWYYTRYVDPTVTMTRDGSVYIGFRGTSAADASGIVGVRRYSFGPTAAAPALAGIDTGRGDGATSVIYSWAGGVNQAYRPQVVSDPNVAKFTDPDTGAVLNDPGASDPSNGGAVFIAYDTNMAKPAGYNGPWDPYVVYGAASYGVAKDATGTAIGGTGNGGTFWTSPVRVSRATHYEDPVNAATHPVLTVTGNNSLDFTNGGYAPGQIVTTWQNANKGSKSIGYDITNTAGFTFGGSSTAFATIADGLPGTPNNITSDTFYPVTVNVAALDNTFKVSNFTVTLGIVHPNVSELQIELYRPGLDATDPTVLPTITLLRAQQIPNSTNTLPAGQGATGANLGINDKNGVIFGTTFDDNANFAINNQAAVAPFFGTFAPDGSSLINTMKSFTPAQLNGQWTFKLRDTRNTTTVPLIQNIDFAQINITFGTATSGAKSGFTQSNFNATTNREITPGGIAVNTPNGARTAQAVAGSLTDTYTFLPTGLPVVQGIGPGVALAVDNSLGQTQSGANLSPLSGLTSGHLYVAFTAAVDMNVSGTVDAADDADTFVSVYDLTKTQPGTGGPLFLYTTRLNNDAASDNMSQGLRHQYSPALAVDPKTGTLVASFYDARYDAANARFVPMLTTSIDGGLTFSAQVPASQLRVVTDVVTGKELTVEPLPSNIASANGTQGIGSRPLGLTVDNGRITLGFTGNPNSPGDFGYTVSARTAAGPRVIYSDVGAIGNIVTTDTVTGNSVIRPNSIQLDNPIAPNPPRFYQYNATRASGVPGVADGTPLLDGIRIVFDRRIDTGNPALPAASRVSSFNPDDVKVYFQGIAGGPPVELRQLRDAGGALLYPTLAYRIDNLSAQTTGVLSNGTGSGPIDPVAGTIVTADTDFVVRFVSSGNSATLVPVGLVGTYSYTLSPFIRDRVRNVVAGVQRDPTTGLPTTTEVIPATKTNGTNAPIDPVTVSYVPSTALTLSSRTYYQAGSAKNNTNRPVYDAGGAGLTKNLATTAITGVAVPSGTTPVSTNGVTDVPIVVQAGTFPANQDLVARAVVQVDLVDTRRGPRNQSDPLYNTYEGLILQLISPAGTVIPLVVQPGWNGSTTDSLGNVALPTVQEIGDGSQYDQFAFENTVFDGLASQSLESGSGRFRGTYRPVGRIATTGGNPFPKLQDLNGQATAGTWYLRIIDNYNADNQYGQSAVNPSPLGYLRSWSLTLVPGTKTTTAYGSNPAEVTNSPRRGNFLDSNADGSSWEPLADSYSAPRSAGPLVLTNGPYSIAINNSTPLTFDPVTTRPVQTGVGIFQQGTFDKTTLPLVIGGPRVLGVATNTTDGRNLNDQVYLNQAASSLYVRFDRAVSVASIDPTKIRVTGPSGPITGPFAVSAGASADEIVVSFLNSKNPDGTTNTTGFTRGGSYTVQFDAGIRSSVGDAVDVNQNAGVDRLFGGNATTAAVNTQSYASTPGAIPIKSAPVVATAGVQAVTGQSVTELPIPVADAFQIAQDLGRYPNARLQLNLRIQDTQTLASGEVSKLFQSLTADLVAPDGTRIRLFSGLGNALAGPGTVSTNIVFDDTALSPIGAGVNPFQTAPYNPQIPLARLLGKWSAGTWKVVLTNTLFRIDPTTLQPVDVGLILSARLTLAGAFTPAAGPAGGVVFNSGLGETRADETTLGFRVYNQDPTSKESSQVWQAVGAAPSNNQANVGRVSAVTIDTADPTGNTVFAAGASGGVWKTTNFLTTDPDGPSWVPLTDFGPTTALNVASIAVFPRANPNLPPTDPLFGVNDPAYTVVFAQTGEGNSVNLPDGNTPWTKPGVGVLRSFDGGRTWSLLDSTTNDVTAANKLTGETVGTILNVSDGRRDHRFVGASGFKIIVDPTPYQTLAGDPAPFNRAPPNNLAVYMAVSDSRPTSDANFAGGVWRSLDSGRTWTRIGWGNATDVAFAPGAVGPDGNLQTLYLALLGAPGVTSGVYITRQATNVPAAAANTIGSLTYLLGGGGNNVIRNQLGGANTAVGVTLQFGPFVSPTRITLATPATSNNPLANNIYQSWLYALSSAADGSVDGLFVTKDYGSNWTLVRLPEMVDAAGNFWGHNDEFTAQVPKNLVTFNATSQFTGNVGYTRDGATADPTTGASLVDPVSGLPSGLLADTPRTYIPRPGSVFSTYGTTPRATGQGTPGQDASGGTGNRALSLAVDPLNPAVVFLGGDRSLRVDTSVLKDAQSYYYFDNTNNFPLTQLNTRTSGGVTMPVVPAIAQTDALEATTSPTPWGVIVPGSANPTDTANGLATVYRDKYSLPAGFVNLSRDPSNPFLNPSVIQVYNAGSFTNSGENASLRPFDNILFGSYDVTSIVPFVDPQTGKTRLIYGTANGIYTGVDTGAANGASLDVAVGDTSQTAVLPDGRTLQITNTQVAKVVTGPRNGNLQIGQYYQGAVQPSRLAADIAGALFYAVSQDNGYPVSSSDVIETGNTAQRTGDWPGTGLNVATDQTGTGTAYQYRLPSSTGTDTTNTSFGNTTDFFRLQLPGADQSASGIGRSGNLLVGQNPFNNQGDWPLNDTRYGTFAVNSLDGAGIVISAAPFGASSFGSAQVFRSIDRGLSWQNLGSPLGTLGFPQYVSALAFGGPDANFPSQRNNYILAGTGDASAAGYATGGTNGEVFFTVNGTLNSWVRVPGDAATGGHSIRKIVPNPRFGTSDFYVLTDRQVFYVKMTLDRTNPAGVAATWTDVTGNLYTITRNLDSFRADSTGMPLPDTAPSQTTVALRDVTGKQLDLTALAVDWRYTNPVLYVAGDGGTVFRTVTFNPANPGSQKLWTSFPDNPAGSYADGGYLPNVRVTDLDLSLGVIDQTYDPANPGKGGMPLLGLDPTTGLPKSGGALNLLVATTYGRGQFVTRINPTEVGVYVPDTSTNPPGTPIDPIRPDAFVSGPRVNTIANITSSSLTVVFDAPVDAVTFSDPADDVILRDTTGARITVTSIKPVAAVPGQPDPRNRYVISFPTQAAGFFYLQVGNEKDLRISDLAGNRMNQNSNLINGETFTSPNGDDTFNTFVYLNGQAKSLLVTGLTSKLSVQTPTTFTVRAINADGTTDTTFAGPVTLTSTDPNVLLSPLSGAGTIPAAGQPLTYAFGAGDLGQHAFTVTFRSGAAITDAAGNLLKPVDQLDGFFRTITVDALSPLYNDGKVGSNVYNARVERQKSPTGPLNASLPAQVSAWDPQTTTANVVDYNGNRLPAFGGILSVASSDPAALLPTPQAYTPLASNGTADFSQIILRTGDTLSAGGKPQTLTYTAGAADGVDPLTVPTNVVNAKLAVTGFYTDPATGKLRTSTYDPQSLTVTVTSALTGKALTSFNQSVAPEAVVNVKTDDDTTAVISVPNIQYASTSAGVGTTKVMFLTKGSPTRTVTLSSAIGVDTNTLTSDVVNAQFQLTNFPSKVSTWNPQAVTVAVVSPVTTKVLPFFSGGVAVSSTDERGAAVQPDSTPGDPLAPVTPTTSQTYNYDATAAGSRVQTLLFRTGSSLSTGGTNQSVTFAGPAGVDAKTATSKVVNAVFRQVGLPDKTAGETATAGVGVGVTVAVGDPLNGGATLKSFVGTVTLGTDDTKATITPNPFTYTAVNNGAKSFVVTYRTSGDKSFTADTNLGKDSKGNLILGVDPLVTDAVVLAADANKFTLTGTPTTVTASVATNFVATLTATDPFGNAASGYTGTVLLSSSDKQAGGLPVTYTFVAADNGSHSFNVALRTSGTQQIIANEQGGAGLSASQTGIVVLPSVASQFTLFGYPTQTTAGDPHPLVLKASDAFGNTATNFTGTVSFSTSDPLARPGNSLGLPSGIPADFTFTAADQGQKVFNSVELRTAGPQSITATSGAISSTQGGITVVAAPASTFDFSITAPSGPPYVVPAGGQVSFSLVAKDRFANTDTKYAGTVQFSSSDPQANLPNTYTFNANDGGIKQFSPATLKSTGTQTITARDAISGAVGTSKAITVQSAAAGLLNVAGFPPAVAAGATSGFSVTLFDGTGNVAVGFTGTIGFSSSDPTAVFALASAPTVPITSYTFKAADAGTQQFVAALTKAGLQTLTVTPTTDPLVNSGTVSTTVQAAAVTSFRVGEFPSPVDASSPQLVRVTALDQFGNTADNYTGLVRLTSSDPSATLPPQSKLTNGAAFFLVTLATPGSQSITASDTLNPAVLGSQTGITVNGSTVPTPTPPVGSTVPPVTVITGTSTVLPFTVTTSPLGTGPNGLVYTATSSNSVLVPPSGLVFGGSGTARTLTVTPAAGQTGAATITLSITDPATNLFSTQQFGLTVNPVPPPPPPPPGSLTNLLAVGSDIGVSNRVTVYNPDGSVLNTLQPFAAGFTFGTRVATVRQADGKQLIAAVPGPGRQTEVKVLDPYSGATVATLPGFEDSFQGGLFVAAGDVNGDGVEDIAISPDQGGGGRVRVFDGRTYAQLADYFGIDDPSFRGGARVTFGDLNGDGRSDLIVAAGFGGGPRVALFDGRTVTAGRVPEKFVGDFFVFEQSLRNGVFVAAGDVAGKGYADLVVAGGPGGGPRVYALDGKSLLSGQLNPVANFFAGDPDSRGGVRITVKNLDGDKYQDIVAGDGVGSGTSVRTYFGADILKVGSNALPALGSEFEELPGSTNGVFVG